MKKVYKSFLAITTTIGLLTSCFLCLTFNTVAQVQGNEALNPANYTIYGNGDEYCRYNNETSSLDVMASTAYKNGYKIDNETELKVELSIASGRGKWLGIGFLNGANYGAPETPDEGVMLYITANDAGTHYNFRIFQTHPFVEKTTYASQISVGTKFVLSLKYDQAAENWYYYADDTKIDAGQAYFAGKKFTDSSDFTYLNFAYENYNNTPIKVYDVSTNKPSEDEDKDKEDKDPAPVVSFKEDANALVASNYTIYGNGDEYCRYNTDSKSLDVMAHTAYKNGFTVAEDTQLKVQISLDSSVGKWLGIGFLSGAKFGAPETTDEGVMLYITADDSGKYYNFRIFQTHPLVEKTTYTSNISIGTKFDLTLKYDQAAKQWYYYANETKIDAGQAYFSGKTFFDKNNKTYLNFAYENNGKNTPIRLYALAYTGEDTDKPSENTPVVEDTTSVKFYEDRNALESKNYAIFGNGDECCKYNSDTKSLDIMAHTAYKNGFKMDQNTVLKVQLSMDSTVGKWLGVGFLSGANFGAPETTDDGVMLYITADDSGKYYNFRIFQMHPVVEKTTYASTIPVGTKIDLLLKFDKQTQKYYYYANGIKIDAGDAYFDGENFIGKNGLTYLNFAYENNGKNTPIKLYSVSTSNFTHIANTVDRSNVTFFVILALISLSAIVILDKKFLRKNGRKL